MTNTLATEGVRLAHRFNETDHQHAERTIVAAMSATKTVRGRNAAGKIVYVQEPDWAIRLPAAVKVCEFVGGKPVAMTVTANLTPSPGLQGQEEFMRETMRDPEAVRSMHDVIDKIAAAAKKAQPIRVTAIEKA